MNGKTGVKKAQETALSKVGFQRGFMNAGISGPNLQIWICIRIEDMVRIPSQMATTILLRCGMVGWAGLTGPWSWKIDLLAAADLFSLHLAEN